MFFNFVHPCTIIIAGPSCCGKTTFLISLMENREKLFNVKFSHIMWCFSEDNAKPEIDYVEFFKGVPSESDMMTGGPLLLILDDLMNQAYNQQITDIFTKGSHHRNISIILVTHNLFHKSPHARELTLSTKYLILFKSPRDRTQFNYLARQVSENPKELIKVYNEVTKEPYSYLLVDLTQETLDFLRYRTDIFNNYYEAVCFSHIQHGKLSTEQLETEQAYIIYA